MITGNSISENENLDDITESTESIITAVVGGKFDIILDVKKINTTDVIDNKQ